MVGRGKLLKGPGSAFLRPAAVGSDDILKCGGCYDFFWRKKHGRRFEFKFENYVVDR
jgi:hypothetical protein